MPKRLTSTEAESFARDGILFPLAAFEREAMSERLTWLEAIESRLAGRLPPAFNLKPHLLVPWLWDLVCDARVVDAVEDLLGPDILCWGSSFFAKQPRDTQYVPWHQDATYWGLSAPDAVTVWVAFTDSTRENGCMRALPRSHHQVLDHGDSYDDQNMLLGRERVLVDVDECKAVDVVLSQGEISIHHLLTIHGSQPNGSNTRRIGFAIRYIAGTLQQTKERGSATLVRGRDHGTFDREERPESEFGGQARVRHAALFRRFMRTVLTEVREDRA